MRLYSGSKNQDSVVNLWKALREEEQFLHKKLANVDRELSNCMHQIELEKWKSGCDGYKLYKLEKEILEKRRQIKDELVIIQSVLDNTKCTIGIKNIEKTFNRLGTRRFEIRIIEDDDFFDEEHT